MMIAGSIPSAVGRRRPASRSESSLDPMGRMRAPGSCRSGGANVGAVLKRLVALDAEVEDDANVESISGPPLFGAGGADEEEGGEDHVELAHVGRTGRRRTGCRGGRIKAGVGRARSTHRRPRRTCTAGSDCRLFRQWIIRNSHRPALTERDNVCRGCNTVAEFGIAALSCEGEETASLVALLHAERADRSVRVRWTTTA